MTGSTSLLDGLMGEEKKGPRRRNSNSSGMAADDRRLLIKVSISKAITLVEATKEQS